jgi:hypothetical protein
MTFSKTKEIVHVVEGNIIFFIPSKTIVNLGLRLHLQRLSRDEIFQHFILNNTNYMYLYNTYGYNYSEHKHCIYVDLFMLFVTSFW